MVNFCTIVGTNGSFKVKFEILYEKLDYSSFAYFIATMDYNNLEGSNLMFDFIVIEVNFVALF